MSLTASEKTLRGQIAANTRWSRTPDRVAATEPARRGLMARFEREVDPDNQLDPAERTRRAENAMRAHMARMRLAASKKQSAAKT